MIQIIPERRQRSTAEKLGRGLILGIQPALEALGSSLLKRQEKTSELEQKRKIFGSLFSDNTPSLDQENLLPSNEQNFSNQIPQENQQRTYDLADLPFEKITEAMALDPELGKGLLNVKESARGERKLTDEYVQSVLQGFESSQASKANLDRMEQLEKSGKLAGPYKSLISKATGIPLSILSNPESEEFEKLVAQRGLNVAQAYGFGRILQTEYENFLRTIPSLMNSPEGRRRIRDTLRYFDSLAENRYKTFNQILKENRGRRPSNIQEQVTARMAPFYDKARDILIYGSELINMVSPGGKKGKVPKNEVQEAMKQGYSLESVK